MAVHDRVIRGGTVFDGTRVPRFRADIAAEEMGKHPVDVMLDMAVEEDLATEFFAAPPNGEVTIRDDRETGTCSGRLLRHGDGAEREEPAPALAAG